jgi:CDP-diacylglycerol--glycerol-3-phosphate 3-phosphatidyltransferase
LLPAAGLVIVLWREFSILFVRNLMLRKGVTMGARWGGKVKAFAYMVAGAFSLLASCVRRLGIVSDFPLYGLFRWVGIGIFLVSIVLAVTSFFDYVAVYRKAPPPVRDNE